MQRTAPSEVIQVAVCFHDPTSPNRFVILIPQLREKDLTFAVWNTQ